MADSRTDFDAIVIGAGAGGLFTAARLAHRGYHTLVVERLEKIGGRASSDDIDGFTVNNGAIVIEVGGITEETCREIGADFNIREPNPPILYRIGGKDVDVSSGGWGFLLSKLTRQGARIAKGIGAARHDDGLPGNELSTAEWVAKFTKSKAVHGIFRNMCASVFAVSSDELPARVFLTYFTRKSAFKRFGFHPDGTIGLWRGVVRAFEADGGQLWLATPATGIVLADGRVTGVRVLRGGVEREVTAPIVVSDIGPAATLALAGTEHFADDYRARVAAADRPCSMITVNFASRDRLVDVPGMLSFSATRRLAYVANFSDLCPGMSPDGWNLYVGTAVPEPSVGDFDEAAETVLMMEDLRDQIPDFDTKAKVLNIAVLRDDWPPQRAVAGFDLPNVTPVDGLWNVGDGVKEYANGGTTACAETARIVVDDISSRYPVPAPA
jgi:phytoene desaturase